MHINYSEEAQTCTTILQTAQVQECQQDRGVFPDIVLALPAQQHLWGAAEEPQSAGPRSPATLCSGSAHGKEDGTASESSPSAPVIVSTGRTILLLQQQWQVFKETAVYTRMFYTAKQKIFLPVPSGFRQKQQTLNQHHSGAHRERQMPRFCLH